MGAPVAVLTAKHEAGFALWPTNTNSRNFSIVGSPTLGGRDLVLEFVQGCRAAGIKPGLYFTTTDAYMRTLGLSSGRRRLEPVAARRLLLPAAERSPHPPAVRTAAAEFEAQQLAQIDELTSGRYGEIAYFWFDHHAGANHPGDPPPLWTRIDERVRARMPGAVLLGVDTSQTGGESGVAAYPLYYTCDTTDGTAHGRCVAGQETGAPSGGFWKSWESDCSIFAG